MQYLEIQGLFKAFCKFKDFPRTSVTIQGLFRTSSQIPGLFKTVQTLDIKLKGFEIQSKTRWKIKNQDGAILRSLLKKRAELFPPAVENQNSSIWCHSANSGTNYCNAILTERA